MNKAGELAKTRKHSLTPGRQVDGGGGCHPSWQLSYLQRHGLNSFFSYMWSVIHSGNLPEQPTMCRSMLSPALNSWDCSFDLTSSSVTGPCSYCKAHVSLASQAKSTKIIHRQKQLAREPHVICKSKSDGSEKRDVPENQMWTQDSKQTNSEWIPFKQYL